MGACTVALLGGRRENSSVTGTLSLTKSKLVSITMPASYDAGGSIADVSTLEAIAGNDFTEAVAGMKGSRSTVTSDDYDFEFVPAALYAPATAKIKAIVRSTGAEAVATTDLSGEVVEFLVIGS